LDLQAALKEQYHSGLAMLRDCVEKCPDDLWTAGTHPQHYWRIAFHAAFFTHLYLLQDEAAFNELFAAGWLPSVVVRALGAENWTKCGEVEPYELPEGAPPVSREDIMEYLAFIDRLVDPIVDTLDLGAAETGFSWYKDMSKLSHELMNLRHIQGHVGQLSELLMAREIDIEWIAKAADFKDSSY
jgi:hypothetical protein